MNQMELNDIAKVFLEQHYQLGLHVPIKRNNRLRSTYGRFIIKNGTAHCIELAGVLLDYAAKTVMINILKHECIHYALFMKGLPFQDGDRFFEKELKKHGAPATRQLLIGRFYLIQCTGCGNTSLTNRKRTFTNPQRYRMNCCHSEIKLIEERIFDGTNDEITF